MSDVDIYFSHAQKANPEISKNQKVWGVAQLKDNFMEFVIFEDDFSEANFVQNIFNERYRNSISKKSVFKYSLSRSWIFDWIIFY